jgi:hypothetical protein
MVFTVDGAKMNGRNEQLLSGAIPPALSRPSSIPNFHDLHDAFPSILPGGQLTLEKDMVVPQPDAHLSVPNELSPCSYVYQ